MNHSVSTTLAVSFLLVIICVASSSSTHLGKANAASVVPNHNHNNDYLSEDSTILITGAAGFLGSELALALYRTYSPKKIILVDRMNLGGSSSSSGGNQQQQRAAEQEQEDLALFEFQRQRAFHVLQTLGSSGIFYRVDFRPMIPEYYDLGEVPVLDHIFRDYGNDITHVIHLADMSSSTGNGKRKRDLIIPREKEVPKAGMIEAIFEQFVQRKRSDLNIPHFIYASSSEVYPKTANSTTPDDQDQYPPFDESKPISTPSSIKGASKLVDELLAKMYYDMHGIYSVGLRFFHVYGPWSAPGSCIFEMAERAVTGDDKSILLEDKDDEEDSNDEQQQQRKTNNNNLNALKDYVYIDDAIDAIMAAMQFRPPPQPSSSLPPPSLVINVATGKGTPLKEIASIMQEYFPRDNSDSSNNSVQLETSSTASSSSVSYGSIERAKALLGYQPHVTLREGLEQTLAWHYDRAFPYGGGQQQKKDDEDGSTTTTTTSSTTSTSNNAIASKGIVSCLPYDTECLRAAPVFPCASECSHEAQCTQSIFDSVIGWTQILTSQCDTVLYTIDLNEDLTTIPSAKMNPGMKSSSAESFVVNEGKGGGACNLAFVSLTSDLVQSLQHEYRHGSSSTWSIFNMIFGGNSGRNNVGQSSASLPPNSNPNNPNHPYNERKLIKHGEWVLIPLVVPTFSSSDHRSGNEFNIWKLLPKLSPGLFFASSVRRAIYCDPDMLIKSIPKLVQEASMQPYLEHVQGATAMLIGKGRQQGFFSSSSSSSSSASSRFNKKRSHDRILGPPPEDDEPPQRLQSTASKVQEAAYRMVRIAAWSSKLFDSTTASSSKSNSGSGGDTEGGSGVHSHGFLTELLDSRWLVHTLQSEDSRLFRCDVLGEVVQWGVDTDRAAFEFILGLHDMWSRVIAKQSGFDEPWWLGDSVVTVPEGFKGSVMSRRKRRQLLEEVVETDIEEENANGDAQNQVEITQVREGDAKDVGEETNEQQDEEPEEDDEVNTDDDEITKSNEGSEEDTATAGGGGFGMQPEQQDVAMQEVKTVHRGQGSSNDGIDEDEQDLEDEEMIVDEGESNSEDHQQQKQQAEKQQQQHHKQQSRPPPEFNLEDRDLSSYDTWMGVLSATSTKYFVRIVPSSEVGVMSLDEYNNNA